MLSLPVMAPTLYMIHVSPTVRAVLMTAKAIGLELHLKRVNFVAGDHLQAEYLQLNPQHSVPTLVDDDGFIVWDSHAIMVYLVSKYSSSDSLYPTNLKDRALVDQRLYFESGVLFVIFGKLFKRIFEGETTIDLESASSVDDAYALLETFLDKLWIAGDSVTIADYSLISTVSSIHFLVPVDRQKFPKVAAWMKKCEQLPEYRENLKGLKLFGDFVTSRLSKL